MTNLTRRGDRTGDVTRTRIDRRHPARTRCYPDPAGSAWGGRDRRGRARAVRPLPTATTAVDVGAMLERSIRRSSQAVEAAETGTSDGGARASLSRLTTRVRNASPRRSARTGSDRWPFRRARRGRRAAEGGACRRDRACARTGRPAPLGRAAAPPLGPRRPPGSTGPSRAAPGTEATRAACESGDQPRRDRCVLALSAVLSTARAPRTGTRDHRRHHYIRPARRAVPAQARQHALLELGGSDRMGATVGDGGHVHQLGPYGGPCVAHERSATDGIGAHRVLSPHSGHTNTPFPTRSATTRTPVMHDAGS
jgi:hypothetical protein